ncbi:polyprotein [Setosphaeria turcica endornavirus 1]|nr:polyprotein [Setosphaeria turcica endornavirus 1]
MSTNASTKKNNQAMKTQNNTKNGASSFLAPSNKTKKTNKKTKVRATLYDYPMAATKNIEVKDKYSVGGNGNCWRKAFKGQTILATEAILDSWSTTMVDLHTFIQVYRKCCLTFGKMGMMKNLFALTVNSQGTVHLVDSFTPEEVRKLVTDHPELKPACDALIPAQALYDPDSEVYVSLNVDRSKITTVTRTDGTMAWHLPPGSAKLKITKPKKMIYNTIQRKIMLWDYEELDIHQWRLLALMNNGYECDLLSCKTARDIVSKLTVMSVATGLPLGLLTTSYVDMNVIDVLNEKFNIVVEIDKSNIYIRRPDNAVKITIPQDDFIMYFGTKYVQLYHILLLLYTGEGMKIVSDRDLLGGISVLEQISRDYNVPLSLISNTQLGNTLLDTINKVANISVRQTDGKAIEVPETMPEEAFNEISRDFGRFNVVRINTGSHPHPYHHASRRAVTKMIVSRYPRGDLVYDIGGDFNYHVSKDNFHVHSVFKTGSPTDEARYINLTTKVVKAVNNRISSLADKQGSQNVAIESVLSTVKTKDNLLWCNNSVGDCNHAPVNKLSFGMSVDTLFHIKPQELIRFYLQNNVVMSTHALTVPKDYKIKKRGNLKYDEGVWTVDDGYLNIVFAGDSTVYSQEVDVLDTYMFQPLIATGRHVLYTRIQGYKAAHLILEHFMLERSVVDGIIFKHAQWINYNYDVVTVRVPRVLLNKPTSLLDREPLEFETEQINLRFYERLLNRMMQPYSWDSLKAYAASNVGRSYMTSAGIEQVWRMSNRSVMAHCIIAYWAMNRQVESMAPLVQRAEERARPTGFFQQLWKVLKNILVDIGNEFDPTTIDEVQNFFSENTSDDLQLVQLFTTLNTQIESLNVAIQLSASHNIVDTVLKTLPIDVDITWTNIDNWRENHDDSNRKTVCDLVRPVDKLPALKTTCEPHQRCPHNHYDPHGHVTFSPRVMPIGACTCCGINSNIFPDGTCLLCTGHEQCSGYKSTCKHTHRLMHEECCGKPVCHCTLTNICQCCGKKASDVYCRLCKPSPSTRPKELSGTASEPHDKRRHEEYQDQPVTNLPDFGRNADGILDDDAIEVLSQRDQDQQTQDNVERDPIDNPLSVLGGDPAPLTPNREDRQQDGECVDGDVHVNVAEPLANEAAKIDKSVRPNSPVNNDILPAGAAADPDVPPSTGSPHVETKPLDSHNGETEVSVEKLHDSVERGDSVLASIRAVTGETSTTYTIHEAMSIGVRRPVFSSSIGSGFTSFKVPNFRYKRVNHVDVFITSIGTAIDDGTCGASSLSQVTGVPIQQVKEWLESAVGSYEWSSEKDLASFAIATSTNLVVCTTEAAHLYMNNTSGTAYAITTTEPIDGNQHWVPCTLKISTYYSSFVTHEISTYYKLLRYLETNGSEMDDWNMVHDYSIKLSDAAAAYSLRGQSWDTILKLFHSSLVTADGVTHKSEFFHSTNIKNYIAKRPSGLNMITAPTGFGKTTQLHTLHKESTKLLIVTPTRANVRSYVSLMQSLKISVAGRADSSWLPNDDAIRNPSKVRIVIMTVNAAFSGLCSGQPNANYLSLVAGRKVYFDEFHMVTPEYFVLCKALGNLVAGVMTATPHDALFDVSTRHPITSTWRSDEAMALLLETYYEEGIHDGELLVVKSKQLAQHTALISSGSCPNLTSETVGNYDLSSCTKAVATNCVTNGVTMPHIKTVIDSGERIVLNMKANINYGAKRTHFFDVVTVRYSINEMIQSRGRVGRTQAGSFIGPVPNDDSVVSIQDQLLMSLMAGIECSNYCHALLDYVSDESIRLALDFVAVNKNSTDVNLLYDVDSARNWVDLAQQINKQKKMQKTPRFVDESLTTRYYYNQMLNMLEEEGTLANTGVLKTVSRKNTKISPAVHLDIIKQHIITMCKSTVDDTQLISDKKGLFSVNMKTKPISWTDDTANKNIRDTIIEILLNDYLTGLNTMVVMYKRLLRLETSEGASQGSQTAVHNKAKWENKQLFSFKPNDNQPVLVVDKTTKAATIMLYSMLSSVTDGTMIVTTNRDLSHMLVSIAGIPPVVTVARLKLVLSRSTLITGPPGSGKTHAARTQYKPDTFVSKQTLMLEQYKWHTPNSVPEVTTLGIDEIAMFNVYELLILAHKADKFIMAGDVNQKVIDDDGLLTARNTDSTKLFSLLNLSKKITLTRTWRFGRDTLNLLNKIGHVYEANDHAKSEIITCRNIHGKFGDKLRRAVHEASPTLIICPTNDLMLWLRREGIHGTAATTTSRSQGFEAERVMYLMIGQPASAYTQSELYVAFTRHTKELCLITDNAAAALLSSKNIRYPDFTHWDEFDESRAGCVNLSLQRTGILGKIQGASFCIPMKVDQTINQWREHIKQDLGHYPDPYYSTNGASNDYTYALSSIASRLNGAVYERNGVTEADNLLVDTLFAELRISRKSNLQPHELYDRVRQKKLNLPENLIFEVACASPDGGYHYKRYKLAKTGLIYLCTAQSHLPHKGNTCSTLLDTINYDVGALSDHAHVKLRLVRLLTAIKAACVALYDLIGEYFGFRSHNVAPEALAATMLSNVDYMPRAWLDASSVAMACDGHTGLYGNWMKQVEAFRSAGLNGAAAYEIIRSAAADAGKYLPSAPADMHELHMNAKVVPYQNGGKKEYFTNAKGEPARVVNMTLREAYSALKASTYDPDNYRSGYIDVRDIVVLRLVHMINDTPNVAEQVSLLVDEVLLVIDKEFKDRCEINDTDRFGTRVGKSMRAVMIHKLLRTARGSVLYSVDDNEFLESQRDIDGDTSEDDRAGAINVKITDLLLIIDNIKSWVHDSILAWCEWAADKEDGKSVAESGDTEFHDTQEILELSTNAKRGIDLFPCCKGNPVIPPHPDDKQHENRNLTEYVKLVLKCENCPQRNKVAVFSKLFEIEGCDVQSTLELKSFTATSSMFKTVTVDHETQQVTVKVVGLPLVELHQLANSIIIVVDKVCLMATKKGNCYTLYWSDNNIMSNEGLIEKAMKVLNSVAGGNNDLIKLLKRSIVALIKYIRIRKDIFVWTTKAALGVCYTMTLQYQRSAKSCYFNLLNDKYFQRTLKLNPRNKLWLQGNALIYSRRSPATVLDCHTMMFGVANSEGIVLHLYAGREERLRVFSEHLQHALGTDRRNYNAGNTADGLRRLGINIQANTQAIDTNSWLKIVKEAAQTNPLANLVGISPENSHRKYEQILDYLTEQKRITCLMEQLPIALETKMAICIPSGHGKTTTVQRIKREMPHLNVWDIDDILTTPNVIRMWDYEAALAEYRQAFSTFDAKHEEPYLMLCHHPSVVPGKIKTLIIINDGASVPVERIWSDKNLQSLTKQKTLSVTHVNGYNDLFRCVVKYYASGGDNHITIVDGGEIVDAIDDFGGYNFFQNSSGPDSLMFAPADGTISVPNFAESLGYQRVYKTGRHVGISRPTIQKLTTSTFNAISTRLHGIQKLRTEHLTSDEYFNSLTKMFKKNWEAQMKEFQSEPISLSYEDSLRWLINKGHKIELLSGMIESTQIGELSTDPTRATAHFKVENLLKEQVNDILDQKGRVIVWNNQNINMFLCPMINECKRRLKMLLNDDLVTYADGMTMTDINYKLSQIRKTKYMVELDLAKQDRQTDRPILNFEYKLLARLGLDGELVAYLQQLDQGFTYTTPEKIKSRRPPIRWTGGAMTSLGNEIRNLLIIADLIDDKEIEHIWTLGDDSLIMTNTEFDEDQTKLIATQRHNVVCTFSQSQAAGLFLQLIICWVDDKYIATHNFSRLQEKLAYSPYPSWSESWKSKYASFLMMIGDTPEVRKELLSLGYKALPPLGTSFDERIHANAVYHRIEPEDVCLIVNDIMATSKMESTEIVLPLTMITPRNKLLLGEVPLYDYQEVKVDTLAKINDALTAVADNYY